VTLDRLDTFSAACLDALTPPAPVSTNNLGKLRTWARYECGDSLDGEGLILCWNPWAVEGAGGCTSQPGPEGCGWAAIAKYPSCAAAVAAVVEVWARDVPHIVANLQADGPWSAWLEAPILGDLAYWIHGSRSAGVYAGWGGYATPTAGDPDPQWGCPFPAAVAPGGGGAACPPGWALVGGLCVPPAVATPVAESGPGRAGLLVAGGLAAAAVAGLVAAFAWPERQALAPEVGEGA
jgi:hypothetical protein